MLHLLPNVPHSPHIFEEKLIFHHECSLEHAFTVWSVKTFLNKRNNINKYQVNHFLKFVLLICNM